MAHGGLGLMGAFVLKNSRKKAAVTHRDKHINLLIIQILEIPLYVGVCGWDCRERDISSHFTAL